MEAASKRKDICTQTGTDSVRMAGSFPERFQLRSTDARKRARGLTGGRGNDRMPWGSTEANVELEVAFVKSYATLLLGQSTNPRASVIDWPEKWVEDTLHSSDVVRFPAWVRAHRGWVKGMSLAAGVAPSHHFLTSFSPRWAKQSFGLFR